MTYCAMTHWLSNDTLISLCLAGLEQYGDQEEEWDEEEWDEEESDYSDYSDSHGSSAYSSDDEKVAQPTDSSSRALSIHRFERLIL